MATRSDGMDADSESFGPTRPGTDKLHARLRKQLPAFLKERCDERGEALSFGNFGAVMVAGDDFRDSALDEVSSLRVTGVRAVEVEGLRVESTGTGVVGHAELRLFGHILGEVEKRVGPDTDDPDLVHVVNDYSSEYVEVDVEVGWNAEWELERVTPTDIAVLVASRSARDYGEFYS